MSGVSTSSEPPEASQDVYKVKRRRLRGSCDECRRRKAKCNSAEMPGNICTSCLFLNIQCRHNFLLGVKKPSLEYTQSLESRIAKFEEYFRRTHPGEDVDQIINGTLPDNVTQAQTVLHSISPGLLPATSTIQDDSETSEDEDLAHLAVAKHLSTLSIKHNFRFFGQSSAFMFATHAHAPTIRNETSSEDNAHVDPRKYRRPFFWEVTPWELSFASSPETPYVYPPDDLLRSLVSLYFEKTNCLIPILHRPTFMKSLLSGQHHSDSSFGMTVLIVCAIGSRYSRDPRVVVPNDSSGMSSGWHYFSQVPVHRKMMLCRSTIYDLQYYALASLYLNGTSIPNAAWNILGIGLRYAVERGAHRRKGQHQKPTAEDELQKRAFWAIVCLDRIISAFVGRPHGYPHEVFDVEYPIECDDEYWETDDPAQAFQQPPETPCSITAFILFIKLSDILGFALRTLYSTKKAKHLSGFVGSEWERKIVAELDSSMNKWKHSLPYYLVWDPERQDALFFHQSANIHATYNYIQIQIHRPFLTKKSSLSFVSLAMCTNAARSCSHILETAMTRGFRVLPNSMIAAFTAGLFIVFGLRNTGQPDYARDHEKDMQNLQRCVNVLKECEKGWHPAGRLGDMLMEAGSISQYEPSGTSKRRRQSFNAENTFQGPLPVTESTSQGSPGSENGSASSIMNAYAMATPMNDWDLHRLLLMDTGHLQMNSVEGTGGIFGEDYGMSHPVDPAYTAAISEPSQFLEGPDIFSWWSDIPTAFKSFEEWEAHLAIGDQL